MDRTKLHFETLQLHVGQEQADPATDARAVPIYQTTSYVFHNSDDAAARFGLQAPGNIYGRLTNSTQGVFEERVAALEGGIAGLAVASGAAAISYAFENITRAGDHIVAAKTIYGGSYNLLAHTLPAYGVTTTFVDPENLDNFEQAIQENTKAVFIETLGNPNCNIIDIDAVADIAHRHRIPLIIDNTFGTPYLIRPIEHGADIVVHSATALHWEASSWTPENSTGRPPGNFRNSPSRMPATTAFVSPTRQARLPTSPVSAPHCCATREPPSVRSMPSSFFRGWKPCPCGWNATWRTP